MSPPDDFRFLPAAAADAEALGTIFNITFSRHPIFQCMFKDTPPAIKLQHDIALFRTFLDASAAEAGFCFTKVVHENKIVSFARWQYPVRLTVEQKERHRAKDNDRGTGLPGENTDLSRAFYSALFSERKKYVDDGGNRYFLHMIATLPEYQHRGLASKLIRVGLADADAAGAEAYVEASADGLPLYLKFGWKPVASNALKVDLTQYGGEGEAALVQLVRPAGIVETGNGN